MHVIKGRNAIIALGLAGVLGAYVAGGIFATPAFAASVTGYDAYVSQGTGQTASADDGQAGIGLLSVSLGQDESLWFRITDGGTVIADRLQADKDTVQASADGTLQLVNIQDGSLDAGHTYGITVYADRDETQQLYEGTISPVMGALDGVDSPIVIAWRTIGSEDRSFNAPATVTYQGTAFNLASSDPTSNNPLTYSYEPADAQAGSASATVTFVDGDGNVIRTDDAGQLTAGGDAITYQVPQLISANGSWYRPVFFNKEISFSFAGRRSQTIECKQVSSELASQQGFHTARIHMVDQDGDALATDQVSVAGPVAYGAPETIFMDKDGDGVAETYVLQDDPQLDLEPTTDDVTDGVKDYKLTYVRKDDAATWQVVLLDATNGNFGRVLATHDVDVTPANTADNPATYTAEAVDVDGQSYEPISDAQLSWVWGQSGPVSYVYCAPRGAALDSSDHTVTVNYVDLATGKRIGGTTRTLTSDMLSDVTIATPERLTVGASTYVRLDGQEQGVRTGYYAGKNATYTVYYRDINDDLNRSTVITTVRVRYEDGGTTVQGGGTTTTAGGTQQSASQGAQGANGSAAAGAGARTGVRSGDDLVAVNGGSSSDTIANGQGESLDTERIDDDETPLASGTEGLAGHQQGLKAGSVALMGFIAAGALLLLLVALKRRKDDGSQAADER